MNVSASKTFGQHAGNVLGQSSTVPHVVSVVPVQRHGIGVGNQGSRHPLQQQSWASGPSHAYQAFGFVGLCFFLLCATPKDNIVQRHKLKANVVLEYV